MFYEKYKATVWGRLEGDEDRMELFVEPWQMQAFLSLMLDNCKVVKFDGGIKVEPKEDDDEF